MRAGTRRRDSCPSARPGRAAESPARLPVRRPWCQTESGIWGQANRATGFELWAAAKIANPHAQHLCACLSQFRQIQTFCHRPPFCPISYKIMSVVAAAKASASAGETLAGGLDTRHIADVPGAMNVPGFCQRARTVALSGILDLPAFNAEPFLTKCTTFSLTCGQ